MRARIVGALLAIASTAACRTGILDGADGGGSLNSAASYRAVAIVAAIDRVAIGRSAPDGCAVLTIAGLGVKPELAISAPPGWSAESGAIGTPDARCLDALPRVGVAWPLSPVSGTVTFDEVNAGGLPCALSVHAELSAFATVNGQSRPANVPPSVRFDVDKLYIEKSLCGR